MTEEGSSIHDETDAPEESPSVPEEDTNRLASYVRARAGPISVYLKGFAMGTAGVVPGVSGGTIALIVGIYDRWVLALTNLDTTLLKLLPGVVHSEGRRRLREAAVERDTPFLLLLFGGLLSAIFTLARVFSLLLDRYPGPTFAFFGGLIGASAIVLYDRRWLAEPAQVIGAVLGFVVAFVLTGATATGVFPATTWMVFLAAIVSVSGTVLPGLSGSFILLVFGQYEFVTAEVTEFGDSVTALVTDGSASGLASSGSVLTAYGCGAVLGFLTTAYAVRAALDRNPGVTFAVLVSLMIGSLRLPVQRAAENTDPAVGPVAVVLAAATLGAGLILLLERNTQSVGYGDYV